MRESLNERIPEVLSMPEYKDLMEFWHGEEVPMYCYYELLEKLFLQLLNSDINDAKLLSRALIFMEDMANSEDIDIQTLLQVQILEALFGLEYNTFKVMEKSLLPKTKELFECTRHFFNEPTP